MRRNEVIAAVFSVTVLVQLAVPTSLILSREKALREGEVYKFRTAPMDPYDAFRGRYATLDIEGRGRLETTEDYATGSVVYALLAIDAEGFARIAGVSKARPSEGAYFRTTVARSPRMRRKAGGGMIRTVRLQLPFDRYYMGEKIAPRAERVYRQHSRGAQRDAYITVRVRNGLAVLEELYVAGKPIGEYLR